MEAQSNFVKNFSLARYNENNTIALFTKNSYNQQLKFNIYNLYRNITLIIPRCNENINFRKFLFLRGGFT